MYYTPPRGTSIACPAPDESASGKSWTRMRERRQPPEKLCSCSIAHCGVRRIPVVGGSSGCDCNQSRLVLWGNKNLAPNMKVKKMEIFQNQNGLKGR